MKNKISYILIGIGIFFSGIIGTYTIMKNMPKEIIEKTEKVVSVTEANTIKSSISKIYDATILVEAYQKNNLSSTGTGFVYKKDNNYGYIITNNHVIDKATSVKILDNYGNKVDGKVLGSDEFADIAVIRIDKSAVLQVAEIGKSSESEIGDTLFTVGSPLGSKYLGTVTKGILSGKERLVSVDLSTGSFLIEALQTDAAINPGNSGGPLCNIDGKVIGINSLKLVEDEIEGMGFAIPIETVMAIIDKLEANEKIVRPYLGVQLIDATNMYQLFYNRITISEKVTSGAVVAYVEDKKPADKAGLKKGDVIVEMNGIKIEDSSKFRYTLYKFNIGDNIKVKYYRGDDLKETTITLSDKVG
ncbi:MAG: S1C family serine protease [Bacilli bacterium]